MQTEEEHEAAFLAKKEQERIENMAIKPEQCVVGTIVYLTAKTAPLPRGKIAGPFDNTQGNKLVIVEWDIGRITKHQIQTLLLEADGLNENQRLLGEADRLEKEFALVEQECGDKLRLAAELISEAAKLAEAKGQYLQDMCESVGTLENAMERAGWCTSSLHC